MSNLILPHKWKARPHQESLFEYMFSGGSMQEKRGCEVWHRRAGKDSCSLQLGAIGSQQRVGTYWHMLPTQRQGRKVIWDNIDKFGRRMIDQAFPQQMRSGINNTEMQIKFKNGSIWQVVGSDSYDSLVGANPIGIVFSEFSLADPAAWDFLRPILRENKGWAVFIFTARGKNHGYDMYQMALGNPKWHAELLTVENTKDRSGNPIITPEDIEEERRSGMAEEKIQQEYYNSWDVGMEGAFYTEQMTLMSLEGRLGNFPWDPSLPVQTWWDIGFRDATSIIYTQENRAGNPRIIDFDEGRNKGLPAYAKIIREKPYVYSSHNGPHDINQTDWSTEQTKKNQAAKFDIYFDDVPNIPKDDGIDAMRAQLATIEVNEAKCGKLIAAWNSYQRKWDEKLRIFSDKPLHNWASHASDAGRYLSVGWNGAVKGEWVQQERNYVSKFKVKRAV